MKILRNFILVFVLIMIFPKSNAYNNLSIYKAFISNDIMLWKETIDKIQIQKSKTNSQILELLNYQYGFIGWCIEQNKINEAEKYIDFAKKNLSIIENNNYQISQVYAYKSAIYGFQIRINGLKAPIYGPKSVNYLKMAVDKNANNWFVMIQQGNVSYYMPSVFGGSKEEGLKKYIKAKNAMEKDRDLIKNNWNYINLLVSIAKAYTELENYLMAEAYYKKVLKIEPNVLLVKNQLYPNILKEIKKQNNE